MIQYVLPTKAEHPPRSNFWEISGFLGNLTILGLEEPCPGG